METWNGEKLTLSNNKLGDKGGSHIAEVLANNVFLKVLHLDENLLDSGSGEARPALHLNSSLSTA